MNPADFKRSEPASADDLGRQHTAAGGSGDSVFIYNETAGDYHLE